MLHQIKYLGFDRGILFGFVMRIRTTMPSLASAAFSPEGVHWANLCLICREVESDMLHQNKKVPEGPFCMVTSIRFAPLRRIGFNTYMMKNIFRTSVKSGSRFGKFQSPASLIVFAAIVILGASGIVWTYYSQNNANRVFWGAVENNLKTTAFTRSIKEDDGSQTTNQAIQTVTSPQQISSSKTEISYGTGPSSVTISTSNIGTPNTDFVQYSSIKTDQKSVTGEPLDFSKVIGVWGKSDPAQDGKTRGNQYNESVLSVVPFGNLNPAARKALIKQMKDTHTYTYSVVSVKHHGLLRRPTYVFSIQINASAYVGVLKSYARVAGLTQLEKVDISQISSTEPIQVLVTVDGWSHQIRQVVYGDAESGRSEQISAYNIVKKQPAIPTQTVSVDELQTRLQSIQ